MLVSEGPLRETYRSYYLSNRLHPIFALMVIYIYYVEVTWCFRMQGKLNILSTQIV